MSTADRRSTRTNLLAARITADVGREIRAARRGSGLSQAMVGRAAGLSHPQIGRIERGAVRRVPIVTLVRACDAVGLRLAVRAYPDGDAVRDAGHVRLLGRLQRQVSPTLRWRTEVPLPIPGDRRAWDAVISTPSWSVAVEAETRIEDVQALLRRLTLKQRDGGVELVVILAADTPTNRAALVGAEPLITAGFPMSARSVLAALRGGTKPAAGGVVLL